MEPSPDPVSVLVGGVGELYQGDLDVGRRAVERLEEADLGPGVLVEDLSYGAVAVSQRLEELRPGALVLVGAEARGQPPGTVRRRLVTDAALAPDLLRGAIADAATGYVSMQLLLDVAAGLGALPPRTVVVAVEPATTGPSTTLSRPVEAALDGVVELVATEALRAAPPSRREPPDVTAR